MRWTFLGLFFLLSPLISLFSEEKIPVAYLLADQIKKHLENQEDKFISALIAGIEARETGILLSKDEQQAHVHYVEKKREFFAQKNLHEAEEWMKELQTHKEVKFIIPAKLAYSLIRKGKGAELTDKNGKVSVNYSIKKLGDLFPETVEKGKELNLTEVIPGLAHGMLSMQEGEIRKIYIHPAWGYQTHNFDPNTALEATVELLHIFPDPLIIPTLTEMPFVKSPEVTQDELDQLQLKDYYVLGWKLWDHLRWGSQWFTKEELISFLKKEPLKISSEQYEAEINQIHWKIYHRQYQ